MIENLDKFSKFLLPAIEAELRAILELVKGSNLAELYNMMAYHLGWETPDYGAGKPGKRIRPLLCLLVNIAAKGNWIFGLPAAVSVELVHNFSLIHDDIQDNSELRRGRFSVWKIWGIPQAINAGDAMLSLAYLTILQLNNNLPSNITLEASKIISDTCIKLTQGQYLDISTEKDNTSNINVYWKMVENKTAALFAASTHLGALTTNAKNSIIEKYHLFGYKIGMAFQVQDDIIGIWGETANTGKSTESDLIQRKKTLPILYGIHKNGLFAKRWLQGSITHDELRDISQQLTNEGGKNYCEDQVKRLMHEALDVLSQVKPTAEGEDAIRSLIFQLVGRNK